MNAYRQRRPILKAYRKYRTRLHVRSDVSAVRGGIRSQKEEQSMKRIALSVSAMGFKGCDRITAYTSTIRQ
jgi:hypothetical protein